MSTAELKSMVFLLVALGKHRHCAGVLKSTHSVDERLVKRHHLLVYFGTFSGGDSCQWEAETKGPFDLIGSTA